MHCFTRQLPCESTSSRTSTILQSASPLRMTLSPWNSWHCILTSHLPVESRHSVLVDITDQAKIFEDLIPRVQNRNENHMERGNRMPQGTHRQVYTTIKLLSCVLPAKYQGSKNPMLLYKNRHSRTSVVDIVKLHILQPKVVYKVYWRFWCSWNIG